MFSGGADWSNIVQYDGLFVLYSLKPRLYIPDFVGYFFKAVRQNPEQKTCVQGYIRVSCIRPVPQHS